MCRSYNDVWKRELDPIPLTSLEPSSKGILDPFSSSWDYFITNDDVLDRVKPQRLKSSSSGTGHVARMPDERPVKALFYGRLAKGYPFLRFKDTLKDILKSVGVLHSWRDSTADRPARWRLISDVCHKIDND